MLNNYTDWNKRIYKVSFIMYDLNDMNPVYFDNIYEFLKFHKIKIGTLVYRLNHSFDEVLYIRNDNATYKLYYIQ